MILMTMTSYCQYCHKKQAIINQFELINEATLPVKSRQQLLINVNDFDDNEVILSISYIGGNEIDQEDLRDVERQKLRDKYNIAAPGSRLVVVL